MDPAREIRIGARAIGPGHPAFVIAEAGTNHEGDPVRARELARRAQACGADCIKFRTFATERVVSRETPRADSPTPPLGDPVESPFELLRRSELARDTWPELMALCEELGIAFLSTPYSFEDVDLLERLGVSAFKLASIHCAEPAFVRYVAATGKPVLLSTGMATLAEVELAVSAFRDTGNEQLVLLQCTTSYPSAVQDANLRALQTLQSTFGSIVGYSDHTGTLAACVAAVALGASVIEQHFTLDRTLPGADHAWSADPPALRELVRMVRETEQALGHGRKEPCEAELRNARGLRRSLAARRTIKEGEVVGLDAIGFLRPATGIPPRGLARIVGATAMREVPAGTLLDWRDFEQRDPDAPPIQTFENWFRGRSE